jgi:hypothetical protein
MRRALGALILGLLSCAPALSAESAACKGNPEDLVANAAPSDEQAQAADATDATDKPHMDSQASKKIREVLSAPEFHPEETYRLPVFKTKSQGSLEIPDWIKGLEKFFRAIAELLRIGVWVLVGIGIIILVLCVHYWWRVYAARGNAAVVEVPTRVGALDIRPETLPEDVGAAARALWLAGDSIGALSLLYRGALSALVTRFAAAIKSSSTEEECLRAARVCVGGSSAGYFESLTRAWQSTVYAGRKPETSTVLTLCDGFRDQFIVSGSPR